ncbi:allophanate hydrolase [Pokkaliibacter plantistimulans]|uniref:Allophanate hydrolase n=1 Tax=Proteobacteria bacterium 228 TaxID=2083153 RepID=A0A2S5KJZ5_9PROT|nr:allophanate hydrolase [Pokkaliibacter plantistimulans]PPC75108.1 allophanate hydrolase [Pokkaliibacter plantistimulans]
MHIDLGWTIQEWQDAYRSAALTPRDALPALLAQYPADDPAWISVVSPAQLQKQLDELDALLASVAGDLSQLPLYGVPFAAKDNIDFAGIATTAACPEFAFLPEQDAFVIAQLRKAGAVLMGKTNLDQFATGLVGTRSPYGEVPNSFKPEYVSGGSSSGSASVVARGLVTFSLGTDTAGSGRVPAGFNNLVGLKPTRGALSNSGLVPACKSIDCITVFAYSVDDAASVLQVAEAFDRRDPYSRTADVSAPRSLPAQPVFGIPASIPWFDDQQAAAAFASARQQLTAMGVTLKEIDFTPLFEMAALLYEGPWVAERMVAVEEFHRQHADAINPVVRAIIEKAANFTAVDTFKAEYRRMELLRIANDIIGSVDALCVPTSPTIYTREQMKQEPILFNSHYGTFTNFVNFADWCALALPGPLRADGLPAGITLIAPTWQDFSLVEFGRRWQAFAPWTRGATGKALPAPAALSHGTPAGWIRVAVVGAHLSGMPLNTQLIERHALLAEQTTTSADYRLFALPDSTPPKPGLLKVAAGEGAPIRVELWDMPLTAFGSFVGLIPPPLGIGNLTLADGRTVKGFICEPWALQGARDITEFGGWRAYIASLKS